MSRARVMQCSGRQDLPTERIVSRNLRHDIRRLEYLEGERNKLIRWIRWLVVGVIFLLGVIAFMYATHTHEVDRLYRYEQRYGNIDVVEFLNDPMVADGHE